ncbi:MAG: N-acyl homoserine lactonase family protein [Gammaproteobacteria bacterium]|nr:N-acyl homoserine lactonase family protein [Gammaproteobacteria bacterium]
MVARAESFRPIIKAVHEITTGYVEQHKEHRYGSKKPQMWWVLTSRSWVKAPITAYAIEHRHGLVLFDTGLDPALVSNPDYISSPVGRFLLKRIFRFHAGPEDALDKQLEAVNLAAADVSKVVVSHLHFDHIGGIAHVPQAELLVSEDEWRRFNAPNPERDWFLREHIELPGAKWQPIEFAPTDDPLLAPFGVCYDCMGDGSMILVPTPGHTPGSMSMLVRCSALPPFLLVGDLTYELESLYNDQVPGVGDAEQLRASFAKVRQLKQALPDLVVLPSHDPFASETLATIAAPGRLEPRLAS